jgi:hypothetical protein
MSNPTHIELILSEKSEGVSKADDEEEKAPVRISRKGAARQRFQVAAGGGDE